MRVFNIIYHNKEIFKFKVLRFTLCIYMYEYKLGHFIIYNLYVNILKQSEIKKESQAQK